MTQQSSKYIKPLGSGQLKKITTLLDLFTASMRNSSHDVDASTTHLSNRVLKVRLDYKTDKWRCDINTQDNQSRDVVL